MFSTWLQHFTSPPTVHNGPSLSTCLPTTVTFSFVSLYLILVVLGLCYCERAFSGRGESGATLHCSEWASHPGGFFCGVQAPSAWASGAAALGLSGRGLGAVLLHARHVESFRTRD